MNNAPQPFARNGTEKMVYDVRMSPQAVWHDDTIFIVYHATGGGPGAALLGHPFAIAYDTARRRWSEPVQLGAIARYDHHYAPIIWRDAGGYLHVLYQCHGADGGVHLVSRRPDSIAGWREGPPIAASISYPHAMPLGDGRVLLYFRTFGHMGNWGYQISDDGGYTWMRPPVPLVDFDQNPRTPLDTWACTYHTARLSADRRWLHIGFSYMDERTSPNPVYAPPWNNRYHLYYARLEVATGELYAPDGSRLQQPLTRASAEVCKLWDTEHRYALNPSILAGDGRTGAGEGGAAFVVPVSDRTPDDVVYYFVRRWHGNWERHPMVRTNDIWAGSHVTRRADGAIVAYVTVGTVDGAPLRYGGGEVECWASHDEGESWQREERLVPEPGLFYNNPKPVQRADGSEVARALTLFGWDGPLGLEQAQRPYGSLGSSGRAYLWIDGEWR